VQLPYAENLYNNEKLFDKNHYTVYMRLWVGLYGASSENKVLVNKF
jgi:hypothetical protein